MRIPSRHSSSCFICLFPSLFFSVTFFISLLIYFAVNCRVNKINSCSRFFVGKPHDSESIDKSTRRKEIGVLNLYSKFECAHSEGYVRLLIQLMIFLREFYSIVRLLAHDGYRCGCADKQPYVDTSCGAILSAPSLLVFQCAR